MRVLDADTVPELRGAPFLVMEYLEGVDLETATHGRPQEPKDVVSWLEQVARGLECAHRLGIVHRDLKPENLFVTQSSNGKSIVKILDFGIAKILDGLPSNTQAGMLVGTPLYMAFEQANGDADRIGPATDMWSLGMIAYRLLTGTSYWMAGPVMGVLGAIVYEPIVAPSERFGDFGPLFDEWFLRSCDRDPSRRWWSVREQTRALAEALEERETLSGFRIPLALQSPRSHPASATLAEIAPLPARFPSLTETTSVAPSSRSQPARALDSEGSSLLGLTSLLHPSEHDLWASEESKRRPETARGVRLRSILRRSAMGAGAIALTGLAVLTFRGRPIASPNHDTVSASAPLQSARVIEHVVLPEPSPSSPVAPESSATAAVLAHAGHPGVPGHPGPSGHPSHGKKHRTKH